MAEAALSGLPPWANIALFGAAALATWLAGGRLSIYAKVLTERTHAGRALVGALLLGGVASLPELVMSVTAADMGDAQLAITTLLGGVPVTLAMVALCDAAAGGGPVSSRVTGPAVLLHGTLLIAMLALLACGMVIGDRPLLGAGIWSALLAIVYVATLLAIRRHEREAPPWMPEAAAPEDRATETLTGQEQRPLAQVVGLTFLAGVVTVIAGYVLAATGGAIAEQTGLGSTLVGMVLGGIATSLPELSTIHAAVKLRQYEMAFGDAFGSNLFSIAIVWLADLAYGGGPLLDQADRPALVATLLGLLSTTIYLAGLIERSRRTVLRLGFDSVLALVVYAGAVVLIYLLG